MTKIIIDITKEDLTEQDIAVILGKIVNTLMTKCDLYAHKDFSAYISEEMTPKKKTPLEALKEANKKKRRCICPIRWLGYVLEPRNVECLTRGDDIYCIGKDCAWYLICYNLSNIDKIIARSHGRLEI